MASWFNALTRTRKGLGATLGRFFSGTAKTDAETLEQLEEALLAADLPPRLAMELTASLSKLEPDLKAALQTRLLAELGPATPFQWPDTKELFSILLVGINGCGKTTTAAKLARLAKQQGRRPVLGAADTFRAAGSSQLQLWAERVGCDAVGGLTGGDSAAVAYDALRAAQARGADTVIVDTAGRMHTKEPLMRELDKIRRSMGKACADAPHETWIVLDASLGQNAIVQARYFNEITPLSGVVISKLDGSSKGGFLFAVRRELNVPILFAGLGEGADDLVPFDPQAFIEALLGGI
jgi:fused signal recognition particle receptor